MNKLHDIQKVVFSGNTLILGVDGNEYKIDITRHSQKLSQAYSSECENFIISASGYGIHWPQLDEDLSIDGLIGVEHYLPLIKSKV